MKTGIKRYNKAVEAFGRGVMSDAELCRDIILPEMMLGTFHHPNVSYTRSGDTIHIKRNFPKDSPSEVSSEEAIFNFINI